MKKPFFASYYYFLSNIAIFALNNDNYSNAYDN